MKPYRSGNPLVRQMRETVVPEGAVALWYLGQEGFLLRTARASVLVDPYLTDSVDRLPEFPAGFWTRRYDSPVRPEALDFLDLVLCTHDHLDHLDPDTIRGIASANPRTRFVVPAPHVPLLASWGIDPARILPARAFETRDLGSGVLVTPLPAAHPVFHQDETGDYAELSYLLRFGDLAVFHGGDLFATDDLPGQLRPFQPDIALLPINGGDLRRTRQGIVGNLGFREAVDLGVEVGADLIVPMHFDLYDANGENPACFVDYLARAYPAQKYHIFQPGERFVHFKERRD